MIELKEQIRKQLNERLEEFLNKYPTRTIASLRPIVLDEFKENGIIKDYKFCQNRNSTSDKVLYFGSSVGFDSMYKVILN